MELKKKHLVTKIDVLGTLRTFEPTDHFFIRTEELQMDYKTFRNKYDRLRQSGFIDGKFFMKEHPNGVLVFRTE
jgi:hypothetical protein